MLTSTTGDASDSTIPLFDLTKVPRSMLIVIIALIILAGAVFGYNLLNEGPHLLVRLNHCNFYSIQVLFCISCSASWSCMATGP